MAKYASYEIKAFIVLQNENGELLMLLNDHPDSIILGYVNPPAGHVEVGESVCETVKREAKEELDINVTNVSVRGLVNVHGFKDLPVLMVVALAQVPQAEKPKNCGEGTPVWVSKEKLKDYKVLEDVEKIIDLTLNTPPGKIFEAVSEFKDRKLISFTVSN